MARGVFISYRRDDVSGYAGRLADLLGQRFDSASVFVDVASIEPGVDWVDAIHRALGDCAVVLVLIGPRWLTATQGDRRRLDDPDDVVRKEIEIARTHGVRVIPVLLQGCKMPDELALPESLSWLTRCNAFELSDRLWADSSRALADAVAASIGATPTLMRASVVATPACLVYEGSKFPLTRVITTIGRRANNDIVFDDQEVSRVHAEIRVQGGRHTILDHDSTNGISVNGLRVFEHELSFGDEISIAGHALRYEAL